MDKIIVQKRLDTLIRHINNVRENCQLLGERLIEQGEVDFGRCLIANGFIHDNSKFSGVEFLYLNDETCQSDPEKFKQAMTHHCTTNFHHPDYWGHISEVPRIYLAEFVCDTKARSEEFGSDYKEWLFNKATKQYKFTLQCRAYKQIKEFMELLLEPTFQAVK